MRIWLLTISCLLLLGCKNSKKGFVIEGTLPSEKYDNEWIYLVPMENPKDRVDSTRISNATFRFTGEGEEMKVLRMRILLRKEIQEMPVVTEPGIIHMKADLLSSVRGTPQNDALQRWKEEREEKQQAFWEIRQRLKNASKEDSLVLIQWRDSLSNQAKEMNARIIDEQGDNTLGKFLQQLSH